MSEIQDKIKEFEDDYLLQEFTENKSDYTEKALAIMKEEINARNLQNNNASNENEKNVTEKDDVAETEELIPLKSKFNRTDLVLAQSILTEEKIPFFVTSSTHSSAIPLEAETINSYSVSIPKSQLTKAQECLDMHFHTSGGLFSAKFSSSKERLKSFCFHDISLTIDELEEKVDVQFSSDELNLIQQLVNKLLEEADTIEHKTEKVLFYFDNLQDCLSHMDERNKSGFTKTDLLTILETLQVYCESEDFPQSLEDTAEALLNFFTE